MHVYRTPLLAALLFAVLITQARAEALPVFSPAGPDAQGYGAALGYPVGPRMVRPPQWAMVGRHSHFDQLYAYHPVARATQPSSLRRAATDLDLHYRYAGMDHDLADYLDRNPATGLLIARDDTILFEHYRYARTDQDRLLSESMAKTITGMLVGIAVQEGAIRSIDEPAADYVPALAGTEYGNTSIRDLLHMSSGVAFRETYIGEDDSYRLGIALFRADSPGTARALAMFNTREAPPGTRFHYAGAETEVLGLVVTNAVHMPLAAFLQSRIWQPMGAEADATWGVDRSGQETAHCCFSAVLRDWARFALLLAHDGAWNGQQIIPRQWLADATSVQAPFLAPHVATPGDGYGYQLWLLPGPRRQFALRGIHGQAIFIDPAAHLVLVHTAVRLMPSKDPAAAELNALWRALVARYAK
jgi:CubicO group peptidase (beta-lactamase class C family)